MAFHEDVNAAVQFAPQVVACNASLGTGKEQSPAHAGMEIVVLNKESLTVQSVDVHQGSAHGRNVPVQRYQLGTQASVRMHFHFF